MTKLIIVEQSSFETFVRLSEKFSEDLNVRVILDRRKGPMRKLALSHAPERRSSDRRRLAKEWNGKDYVVIHVVDHRRAAA